MNSRKSPPVFSFWCYILYLKIRPNETFFFRSALVRVNNCTQKFISTDCVFYFDLYIKFCLDFLNSVFFFNYKNISFFCVFRKKIIKTFFDHFWSLFQISTNGPFMARTQFHVTNFFHSFCMKTSNSLVIPLVK